MKTSRTMIAAIAMMIFGSVACTQQPKAKLDVPTSFAKLGPEGAYVFKAATARGVVVAVRTETNKIEGSPEFWADVIDERLRERGYTSESQSNVKSENGVDGRQMRYSKNASGRDYRYWVTVFVKGAKVHIVEAGGDKEVFDPSIPEVEKVVLSLHEKL